MLARAQKARTWFKLDVLDAAAATGSPREKIVAALNYLEEQGDLVLQVAGVRQGYRLKKPDVDREALAKKLVTRFAEREQRDVERLAQVLAYATHPGCLTRYLLRYFGEDLPADCGHCARCAGEAPEPIPSSTPRRVGEREATLVRSLRAERQDALATPRQMARFLCGLNSPQATRAKLGRHQSFGALADAPFRDVLAFVEELPNSTG
jgi:ATP-dependent DNA helicase RecQ